MGSMFNFGSQNQTVSGSSTSTTSIDTEGLDYLMKELLKSTQGLASVTQGQMTSGLYNSSTNTLLANDLVTQAAGYAASKNATTTTNTSGHTNQKSASASTVICTHMHTLGLMTQQEYIASFEAPRTVEELRGYQIWAVPLVKYLRKNTYIGRTFIGPVFYSLAIGRNRWYAGTRSVSGFFAVKIIQPFCGFLGKYFVKNSIDTGVLYNAR